MRIAHALPLLALLTAACTGAASSDLFGDPPGGSSDGTQPAPTSTSTTPAPTPAPAPTLTAAPPPTKPPPSTTDSCTPEEEPNDSQDEATSIQTCFNGKIGSKGDVDYATFDAPVDASRLSYTVTSTGGKVAVRVLLEGQVAIGGAGTDNAIAPGASYIVEVRLAPGDTTLRPSYQVNIAFK